MNKQQAIQSSSVRTAIYLALILVATPAEPNNVEIKIVI